MFSFKRSIINNKMMSLILIISISGATCLAAESDETHTLDYNINISDVNKLTGMIEGHHFRAEIRPGHSFVEIEIKLVTGSLLANIGLGKERGNRQYIFKSDTANLNSQMQPDDRKFAETMLASLAYDPRIYETEHGKMLLRLLNLVSSWPVEEIDINRINQAPKYGIAQVGPNNCNLPPEQNGINTICQSIGQEKEGKYADDGQFCGIWRGLKINRPNNPWANSENLILGANSCVGRCGKGCIGDGQPNNGLNIYTQDCLNHDLCVGNRGMINAECNWMFILAEDDFWNGPDCTPVNVVIDIKASDKDEILYATLKDNVKITISLDPTGFISQAVDWWIYAETPTGSIYRKNISPWLSQWGDGIERTATSKLKVIDTMVVFNKKLTTAGDYRFSFAVDNNNDGIRDETWSDSVLVIASDADMMLDGNIGCAGNQPALFFQNMPVNTDKGDFSGESQGFDYNGTPVYFRLEGNYNRITKWISTSIFMYYDPDYLGHVRTDMCEDSWSDGNFYDEACDLIENTSAGCVPIYLEMTPSGQQSTERMFNEEPPKNTILRSTLIR